MNAQNDIVHWGQYYLEPLLGTIWRIREVTAIEDDQVLEGVTTAAGRHDLVWRRLGHV